MSEEAQIKTQLLECSMCGGTMDDKGWEHLGPAVTHQNPLSKPLAALESVLEVFPAGVPYGFLKSWLVNFLSFFWGE